ncbi:MAG: hypothetical protein AAB963_01775 [Patescibacteria group bacterium]
MSIFGSLFGLTIRYSQVEHPFSEFDIKKLVSPYNVRTLKQSEAGLVEQAIVARRRGDGKISLQQIYETLTQLKNQLKISRQDRDGLMKDFEEFFNK